ncbi:DNA translocase FtsK [Komagataeibacter rhaeticus]|uniref:DNA translocase FtsK n=1 Tax=Komagataeibacter rhaeticus TaxID=215221 RepID=A0A181C6F6_9PROT|nr:DNA translocase FtsK [Komagataeibacter rhaeticus]ATU73949.1 cell division protein FtsK [Komagataeibacter xylinus]QIP34158.1 cell division protein FtsK [Komagataeibacter rhaeticus]QOC46665.1 DNA translocase FtsK 4TM domain-containing protein [Komagataeibacter rhaeticus]WPP20964.1 DNA translocase FtsK 4TM domain-containing protein [Komagataeibacter rhaeticus]SAY47150.1 DNA translocase FtsK [Komagataeibacter rhaeticus]
MAIFSRFVPDSLSSGPVRSRLRERLAEAGGLGLWIVALCLAMALWSYDPRDPSANTASGQAPANLLGRPGAYMADFMLQDFGIVGMLAIFCLLAWGWRLIRHHGLASAMLRFIALICGLPVIAADIAALPLLLPGLHAPLWPTDAGVGGAVGLSVAHMSIQAATVFMGHWGPLLVWLLGLVLGGLLLLLAMALSLSEWKAMGRGIRFVLRQPMALAGWLRHMKGRTRPAHDEAPAAAYPDYLTRGAEADAGAGEGPGGPGTSLFRTPRQERAPVPTPPTPGTAMMPLEGRPPAKAVSAPEDRSIALAGSQEQPGTLPARKTDGARPAQVSLQTSWMHPPGMDEDVSAPLLMGGPVPTPTSDRAPWHEEPPVTGTKPFIVTPEDEDDLPVAAPEPARPTFLSRLFSGGGGRQAEDPQAGPEEYVPPPTVPSVEEESYTPPPQPEWQFPPLSLLRPPPSDAATKPTEELLQANATHLVTVLSEYGVQGEIVAYHAGPVVTLYELQPAAGIRAARVIGLADDVARSLSVLSVRIATVPGRNVIGIEVPNARRETVYFSELLQDPQWAHSRNRLNLALGKDIAGESVYSDLGAMPHLLIAGTTGSGKSVGVNSMILSLLYRLSPEQCRLILIDPKILELSIYEGIPHLMTPVVTEPAKAVAALKWAVREMDRRYRAMAHLQVRNIASYNERVAEARARGEIVTRRVQTGYDPETGKPTFEEQQLALDSLAYLVIVVDEMADLMIVAGKEIEALLQRLAQKARAAGIHLILATQRPSVDVITGTIKANFPTRISFQVISKFDSRTILGEQGAEQLLGRGDMLFMQAGGRITRVHGPFVDDSEVEAVVAFLRTQGEPIYDDDVISPQEEDSSGKPFSAPAGGAEEDGLFAQAVEVVAREGKASTSFIQRHLSIGYNRAAKIIEQMEKEGLVSEANHVGRREVLMRRTTEDE